MIAGLETAALVRGAGLALAVLVPVVVLVRAAAGTSDDSPAWYLVVVAFLVSFTAGGALAARTARRSPLKHAAAAGAAAFGVALVAGIARNLVVGRSMSGAALVTAILLWQIAASLALLGGIVGRVKR